MLGSGPPTRDWSPRRHRLTLLRAFGAPCAAGVRMVVVDPFGRHVGDGRGVQLPAQDADAIWESASVLRELLTGGLARPRLDT